MTQPKPSRAFGARSVTASSHHPSRTEAFSTPFIAAFIPEVPDASKGRSGVLSQTSTPLTSSRARSRS
jgi:hypothetical protein